MSHPNVDTHLVSFGFVFFATLLPQIVLHYRWCNNDGSVVPTSDSPIAQCHWLIAQIHWWCTSYEYDWLCVICTWMVYRFLLVWHPWLYQCAMLPPHPTKPETSPHLATHQDSNQDTQMSCHHCFVDQDHVGAVALFDLLSLAFDIMTLWTNSWAARNPQHIIKAT